MTFQRDVQGVPVGYVLFNTIYYPVKDDLRRGKGLTLNNAIKTEAYDLVGLDSIELRENPLWR